MIHSLEIPAMAELARLRQWVGYRARDKAPICYKGGLAESNDPETWTDFPTAVKMAAMHDPVRADGVGFVFAEDDDLTGFDLDGCLERNGEPRPWAKSICSRIPTFTEVSLSGAGLHLYVRGKAPRSCQLNNKLKPELPSGGIYPIRRYFAMTDRMWGSVEEIREGGAALIEILEEWEHLRGGPGRTSYASGETIDPNVPFQKFEALLENDTDFRRNWHHKWTNGDLTMSGYDLRLAIIARKAGWSDGEIAGLIVEHRTKWAGKLGKDAAQDLKKADRQAYLQQTVANAQDGASECLRGGASLKQAETKIIAREAAENVIEEGSAIQDLRRRLGIPVSRVVITGIERSILYWLVIDGDRRVCLGSAADILSQARVRTRLLAETNVVMNSVKQVEWDNVVRILLGCADREDAADSDPVYEIAATVAEYAEQFPGPEWDNDLADSEFEKSRPVRRDSNLMISPKEFLRWAQAKGALMAFKLDDLRNRFQAAGSKGEQLRRRYGPFVKSRFYWTATPLLQKTLHETEKNQ